MFLELHLVKSDNDVWGFRLTGGADYNVPFIVINVYENSIAKKSGLKCNDVIETINNISVSGFTHNETHNLLLTATNELILGIKRGLTDIISPATCDSKSNEEIANIMQVSLQNQEQLELERQEYYEIVNPLDQTKNGQETQTVTAEAVVEKQTTDTQQKFLSDGKERKWSTFLQKPKHPVPEPKKLEDTSKVEPYRVIIKKQTRKDSLELKQKDTNFDKDKSDSVILEDNHEPTRDSSVTPIKEVRFSSEAIAREESEEEDKEEKESNGDLEEELSKEDSVIGQETRSDETEPEYENDAQLEKMLEEKLLEVQKQLEALSKLPSTIQSTIDAVTKQLASIVSVTSMSVNKSEEKVLSETSSESGNDLAEQIITEESNTSSEKEEEEEHLEKDTNEGENKEEVDFQNDNEKNEHKLQNIEEDKELTEKEQLDADIIEKEKQAERIEEELLERQQKEPEKAEEFLQRRLKQKPTLPLKPIERPIILPGGRKWSQPDDACSSFRQPKMSDETIANTIEIYSEVIVGKTKGINFMKYQPPPKNLDYLQRSDVYKLVHDLEPPVRGIGSRAPKILSAQDYYQAG